MIRTVKTITIPALVAFILAVPARPVAAQTQPNGVFSETLDVRVVNVEVVVTDRQGVRVHGLSAEDFRLLVDGEAVPIDYFTEIRGGVAIAGSPNAPGEIPAIAPGESLGTSYLLFIDDYFSVAKDRNRVLRQLLDDLSFLEPADRLAIVAWDGRRLEMLANWSSSQRELESALRLALERPTYGLQRLAERRQLDRFYPRGRYRVASFGPGFLQIDERVYAARLVEQIEGTMDAAVATLRSFAQPPGRRVMLLLSGGWPWRPVDFVADDPFAALYEPSYAWGEEIYGALADTANLLGYTLYPADVPGLQNTISDSTLAFARSASVLELSFDQEDELHYTLRHLAAQTGGQALVNGSRVDVLTRAHEDTRSFYWLGFTPARQHDDASRRIEVEVQAPGLKVRTRDGYGDLSVESEVAMAVESALLFGYPASANRLEVQVGEARGIGWGKVEVPLEVSIPMDAIVLQPEAEDVYVARLDLQIAVMDADGRRSEVARLPLELHASELPAAGESWAYETALKMRRKDHDLFVAVYDRSTGTLLSAAAQLEL